MQESVECFASDMLVMPVLMGRAGRDTTKVLSVWYFLTFTSYMTLKGLLPAHLGFFFPIVWKQTDLQFPTAKAFGCTVLPECIHLMLK